MVELLDPSYANCTFEQLVKSPRDTDTKGMTKLQSLRLFTIVSAIAIGLWFPIILIGYRAPLWAEIILDVLVSLASLVSLYLRFADTKVSPKEPRFWLRPGVLADLVCGVPLALIEYLLVGATSSIILVINLLCARHIFRIKKFLDEFDGLQPIFYRLIPLMFTMPILVHFISCGWIALGSGTSGPIPNDPVLEYVKALYWAFTTLTTVGYGDISAETIPQMFFAAGAQLIGVAVFGFVLSNVASLLTRMDAAREHHMDNLDRIETFMRMHKVNDTLRLKIRSYYKYLWENKKGYQDKSLLKGLPEKIQSELFFSINKSIIDKVPFLRGSSEDLLEDLMNKLESRIFVPGEKVFRVDEVGDALYFIQSGDVDIVLKDGAKVASLTDGAFFGEMALLSDRPRSATAIARTYCDTYVLHKTSFLRVMETHAEFKRHMEQVVAERKAS